MSLNMKTLTQAFAKASAAIEKTVQTTVQEVTGLPRAMQDYDLLDQIGSAGPGLAWKLFTAKSRDGHAPAVYPTVCVWVLDKKALSEARQRAGLSKAAEDSFLDVIRADAARLVRLRHPGVVHVVQALDESKNAMTMVTEPLFASAANALGNVENIAKVPKELKGMVMGILEIKHGLLQIAETLDFLHNNARLIHRAISPETILITSNGAWKLGGFGFAVSTDQSNNDSSSVQAFHYAVFPLPLAPGDGGGGPSTSLLSFLCPLLKLFSAGDPSAERNYLVEEATSSLSTLARLPWGSKSLSDGLNVEQRAGPPLPLQLYEFEACPFCRRVRESITELDLSVEIFPCPKGSVRHRAMVRQLGGREQFPFLVDPNTGTSIYESSDIVKYLFKQYGGNRSPSFGILESTLLTGWVPTLLRAGRGMTFWEDSIKESPLQKLELFSYENNPYARIVREALCELEIPYILQSVGEGSIRERLLQEISGSREVPYLVDHNTGMKIGDYKKIIAYLFETYSSKRVAGYAQQ